MASRKAASAISLSPPAIANSTFFKYVRIRLTRNRFTKARRLLVRILFLADLWCAIVKFLYKRYYRPKAARYIFVRVSRQAHTVSEPLDSRRIRSKIPPFFKVYIIYVLDLNSFVGILSVQPIWIWLGLQSRHFSLLAIV